jgi:CRP/FNR family cyclic AMP-dependent transcriptional regulator
MTIADDMSRPRTSTLKAQRLFKNTSDEIVALADRYVRYQQRASRQIVVSHGDPDSPLVLVISGRLQVSSVSEDGHETGLGQIKAGESFGESAIVLDTPIAASVIASTSVVVGLIGRVQARKLFCDHRVSVALLAIVSNKLHRAVCSQSTLSMPRAYARVCAVINAVVADSAGDARPLIELPNQASIAIAANVSRETVSRAMKLLIQRGGIVKEGRHVRICDRSVFAKLAADDALR